VFRLSAFTRNRVGSILRRGARNVRKSSLFPYLRLIVYDVLNKLSSPFTTLRAVHAEETNADEKKHAVITTLR